MAEGKALSMLSGLGEDGGTISAKRQKQAGKQEGGEFYKQFLHALIMDMSS